MQFTLNHELYAPAAIDEARRALPAQIVVAAPNDNVTLVEITADAPRDIDQILNYMLDLSIREFARHEHC